VLLSQGIRFLLNTFVDYRIKSTINESFQNGLPPN
jgi:hypothetical protein